MRRLAQFVALSIGAALILTGCVGETIRDKIAEGREASSTAEELACENLDEGPATPVTAALDAGSAPEVKNDRRRYDVTLVEDGGPPRMGSVRFEAPSGGDYLILLDSAVSFELADAGGVILPPASETEGSADCDLVSVRFEYRLEAGAHTLSFGPTNAKDLSVVIALIPEEMMMP